MVASRSFYAIWYIRLPDLLVEICAVLANGIRQSYIGLSCMNDYSIHCRILAIRRQGQVGLLLLNNPSRDILTASTCIGFTY